MFWIRKNQTQNESAISTLFFASDIFQIQNISFFFTFYKIRKLSQNQNKWIEIKIDVARNKKVLAGGVFTIFPAGGEFSCLTSYKIVVPKHKKNWTHNFETSIVMWNRSVELRYCTDCCGVHNVVIRLSVNSRPIKSCFSFSVVGSYSRKFFCITKSRSRRGHVSCRMRTI